MHRFAKIISIIFHPLWMPLLIFILSREVFPFFSLNRSGDSIIFLLLIVNCVAPAMSIYMMKRHGIISSIELNDSRERTRPYSIVILYYIGSWALLLWRAPGIWPEVMSMFIAVVISLTIAMIINLRWKISVHMIAAGGMFGIWMALGRIHNMDVNLLLLAAIIVALMVGWSRVKLKAHDQSQVYAGWLLGVIVNYLALI